MPLYTVTPHNILCLDEIRRLCEEGAQAHGDEFYGPILALLDDASIRLLDFPSSNQALLHVARGAYEVKLVKSVSEAARLLKAGVEIEVLGGEAVGLAPAEEEPAPPPAPEPETPAAPPPVARRPGRPRKNPPPEPVPGASGAKPAAEALCQPNPPGAPPAPSEALIETEAQRVGGPRKSLFERMSDVARNATPAPPVPPGGAKEGATDAKAVAPEKPGSTDEARPDDAEAGAAGQEPGQSEVAGAIPSAPGSDADAPAAGFDAAGQQEGADQPKEEAAPSETGEDAPTRPEPMFKE